MPHEIETRIADWFAAGRGGCCCVYGLSWVVAAVVAATLVLGLADYRIHFRDPGIRVLSLLALLARAGLGRFPLSAAGPGPAIGRRHDRPADRTPLSRPAGSAFQLGRVPQSLAGRPPGRLGGAARAGDRRDRRRREGSRFDRRCSSARPTRRALAGAAAVIALAAAAVLLDPRAARLALARLANPLRRRGLAPAERPGVSQSARAGRRRADVRSRTGRQPGPAAARRRCGSTTATTTAATRSKKSKACTCSAA